MKFLLMTCLAIGLSACASQTESTDPEPKRYTPVAVSGEVATPQERAACNAVGGDIVQDGLLGWEQCRQTYPDAGQPCSDSSECLGRCDLVGEFLDFEQPTTAGTCQETDSPFGCYQSVQNGKATPAICVD